MERDEDEDLFDEDPAWMEVDTPEDEFLSRDESSRFKKFTEKLDALRLEDCDQCFERDFNMDVRNGACHRCRADRPNPVRKFAHENNIHPGVSISLRST